MNELQCDWFKNRPESEREMVEHNNVRPVLGCVLKSMQAKIIAPVLILAAAGGSVGQYLLKERSARAFCSAVQHEQAADLIEAAALKAGFEVYPFKGGDGMLLVRHHIGLPPGSFNCEVRYQAGRVRSAAFFAD